MLQRFFLYGFLLLILFGGGYSLLVAQQEIGATSETEKTARLNEIKEPAEDGMVGEKVTFTVTESDHKKWELRVEKAVYFTDRTGADLTGVSGDFYDLDGNVIARFVAPTGQYKTETKSVTLTNGVSVTSANGSGSGITAPTVVWSAKSDKVVASGGVRVTLGKHATLRASRCDFDLDFSKVSLMGAVHSAVDF